MSARVTVIRIVNSRHVNNFLGNPPVLKCVAVFHVHCCTGSGHSGASASNAGRELSTPRAGQMRIYNTSDPAVTPTLMHIALIHTVRSSEPVAWMQQCSRQTKQRKHPPWGSNPRPQGSGPCALPTELGGLLHARQGHHNSAGAML